MISLMRIKDLQKIDLPREKFEKYGSRKLSDHELLAILLGSGIKGLNVLELSKKIVKTISKIGIGNITLENLLEIKGLGKAKAISILASIEFAKRVLENKNPEILSAEQVWQLTTDINSSMKEHFVVFYIDSQNKLIERRIVSIGILNASLVHPREVFEPALTLSASHIILCHNHPSGTLEPSREDFDVTKRLVTAGKILGMEVVDHVIVGKQGYKSLKEKLLL